MFQFRIRELLLFTLVVALFVGWAVDHRWQARTRQEAEARANVAVQSARQSEKRLFVVQAELNEHILARGPLLKVTPTNNEQTLELRSAEPPARDPDL